MRIDKAMLLKLQPNFRDTHLNYKGETESVAEASYDQVQKQQDLSRVLCHRGGGAGPGEKVRPQSPLCLVIERPWP